MKIFLCNKDDRNVKYFLSMAKTLGQEPFLEKDIYWVEVLNHGNVWRAPDAVFRPVKSGNYYFKDGNLYYEEFE